MTEVRQTCDDKLSPIQFFGYRRRAFPGVRSYYVLNRNSILNGPAVSPSINFLVSDNEIGMVGSVMGTVVGGSTTGTSVVSVLLGRGRGL